MPATEGVLLLRQHVKEEGVRLVEPFRVRLDANVRLGRVLLLAQVDAGAALGVQVGEAVDAVLAADARLALALARLHEHALADDGAADGLVARLRLVNRR